MKSCPYCLDGSISNNECVDCGQEVRLRDGIPSTTDVRSTGEYRTKLQKLTGATKENLDSVLEEVREDYMDGRVIDRFFKTRTVCWRVLVSSYLSGRGLVIGDHEEKVGILLSELLDEVYCADTDVMSLRAQESIANATENKVKPVHSTLETLPFPSESFDTIVVSCRANQVSEYVSKLRPLTTEDGAIVLLVDGWTRETGMTGLLGLGDSPEGWYERAFSSIRGHSYGLHRAIERAGLSVCDQYALLSTTRHENQRGFDVHSIEAHDWLLRGSEKTASTTPLRIARSLSRIALQFGFLRQCYPRYTYVCQKENIKEKCDSTVGNGILLAGKNRSTYLDLDDGQLQSIRKVPNSRWQGALNKRAQTAIESNRELESNTLPAGEIQKTDFGPERIEKPVNGVPLDQCLKPALEDLNKYLQIIFDWLCEFQQRTTIERVQKEPEEIRQELTVSCMNLTDPPHRDQVVEIPQTTVHGDFFGSNIYIDQGRVSSVIDWEWARIRSNPIVDPAFLILQIAASLDDEFKRGFSKLFLEENKLSDIVYSQISEYCTKIGIAPDVFITYLSIGYIYRSKDDLNINKRLDIDWPKRVRYIWENQDRIRSRMMDA